MLTISMNIYQRTIFLYSTGTSVKHPPVEGLIKHMLYTNTNNHIYHNREGQEKGKQ